MKRSILKIVLNISTTLSVIILTVGCNSNVPNKAEQSFQTSSTSVLYRPLLEQRVETERSVGLAVAIIDNDKQDLIFSGLADKGTQQKINKDSVFEIGSITKTFTTIVLADMVIKGEISLDDPASKYLPETVSMPKFLGRAITLKDLATHSSALPPMPDNFNPSDPSNPYADYTPELMYAFLSGHELERAIGEEVVYSNLGMGLLGHILALHSGQSYEQLVTERILKPLAMANTSIIISEDNTSHFATGHDVEGKPTEHWDISTLAGAGALRSNLEDMTIYLKANMGLLDTPLADAIAMSQKFQINLSNNDGYVGLGWFTQNMDGRTVTWHNGGTGGFRTFLGFDLRHERGVVVLANAQDDPDLIGRAILAHKPELLEPDVVDSNLNFSPEELEIFVGEYQLAPNFIITITHSNTNLFLQATGQGKLPIFAKSKLEFYLKAVDAAVIFKENDNGEIISLILDQGGMMQPAPKL